MMTTTMMMMIEILQTFLLRGLIFQITPISHASVRFI